MTPQDYEYLKKFLKDRSGLVLSNDKQYLIESRLLPIARKHGLNDITDLVAKLRAPGTEPLAVQVTEAMTTNESFFFRDKTPFDHFKEHMMPHMLKERAAKKSIRIWCAAASTGQEPYSLAMILKDMGAQLSGWRIDIIGTDLSSEVLDKAKAGNYSQFEVQRGLPIQMLMKYFVQNGDQWTISPEIRAMVQYRTLNLLNDFAALGGFDIIYCRNVLIYFDQHTKADVLNRMAKMLAPDGFLLLGAAETVVGLTEAYKPMPERRGLYVNSGAPGGTPARLSGTTGMAPMASTSAVAGGMAPRPVVGAPVPAPTFTPRPQAAAPASSGFAPRPAAPSLAPSQTAGVGLARPLVPAGAAPRPTVAPSSSPAAPLRPTGLPPRS